MGLVKPSKHIKIGVLVVAIVLWWVLPFRCMLWGSYRLGAGLYMMDGDCKEDRIIVFNNNLRLFQCCFSGSEVIPTYERHYFNDGKYDEYVTQSKHNRSWVIVESYSIRFDSYNYWIINKSLFEGDMNSKRIIDSCVYGPLSRSDFDLYIVKESIEINF